MSEHDRPQPEPATGATRAANAAAASAMVSFDDVGDHERASRGLVAQLEGGRVTMNEGQVVLDVANHAFVLESEAPDTVHPGLWRQAQLNQNHGLYEVADGVWQVRGYDLAVITFMAGTDGWLVIDPLTNAPAAAASLALANAALGERPVTSVIYTHSHVDHFGGIMGVTSQEAVDRGDVRIVAPAGFLREVVDEFVIAGPIMGRRASYQFGPLLPAGPRGHVDCGLGSAMGLARSDLIAPTEEVTETGQELTLSGIPVVFQMTPDAEAPAEMNFYFPERNLLCMAENCTHTLHNLYPIRGAQTRDALAWSKYIHEALRLWGDRTDAMFASHHWPRFGRDDVRAFLTMQRDVYRWLHDQTMRLANQGLVPAEISAELRLPEEFDQSHVRGYYGTVSHNAKSVYTKYLGWYDGNPAHLDPLPPTEAGARYVAAMGGADALLATARAAFDDGDYRWVAELVNHLVFADPDNTDARRLQAAALEQLGYQAESATWRNAYLMGAKELREGSPDWGRLPTRAMAGAMEAEHVIDVLGVRFDPAAFDEGPLTVNIRFADLAEDHVLGIGRSALHHTPHAVDPGAVATLTATRQQLIEAVNDPATIDDLAIAGGRDVVGRFLASLTAFTSANLIEP